VKRERERETEREKNVCSVPNRNFRIRGYRSPRKTGNELWGKYQEPMIVLIIIISIMYKVEEYAEGWRREEA
jgi:hypothetical protein